MARLIRMTGAIEDDRGVRHAPRRLTTTDRVSFRLRTAATVQKLRERPPASERAKYSALLRRRMLRNSGPPPERTWWFWGGLLVLQLPFIVMYVLLPPSEQRLWLLVTPLTTFSAVWFFTIRHDRQIRRDDRERLPTLVPACMVCAYDLTGVPIEEDGCTVCPECGAAWKIARGDGACGS